MDNCERQNRIKEALNIRNMKPIELCEKIKVPMVLDYHHHICNNNNLSETNFYINNITNLTLTEEQINKFKQSHLEVFHNGEKISTKYAIDNYKIKDFL